MLIKSKNNEGPPRLGVFGGAGQTIIEAVVALSVIMLILGAITVAVLTSLNSSEFIKSQSLAVKLAQQGMEKIRYMRNNDPVTFNAYAAVNQAYCMPPDNSIINPQAQCTVVSDFSGSNFIREVVFGSSSADCSFGTKVTVRVYWSSGKCGSTNRYCHKSELISCFSKQSSSGFTL
jgi:type II secretory pathway pseudopilin PulG